LFGLFSTQLFFSDSLVFLGDLIFRIGSIKLGLNDSELLAIEINVDLPFLDALFISSFLECLTVFIEFLLDIFNLVFEFFPGSELLVVVAIELSLFSLLSEFLGISSEFIGSFLHLSGIDSLELFLDFFLLVHVSEVCFSVSTDFFHIGLLLSLWD
jgi:hypothetical protein